MAIKYKAKVATIGRNDSERYNRALPIVEIRGGHLVKYWGEPIVLIR